MAGRAVCVEVPDDDADDDADAVALVAAAGFDAAVVAVPAVVVDADVAAEDPRWGRFWQATPSWSASSRYGSPGSSFACASSW